MKRGSPVAVLFPYPAIHPMPEEKSHLWPKLAGARAHIDSPQPGASVYGECISLAGWCHAPGRDAAHCRVRAWAEDAAIGETRLLFVRPDVCAALDLAETTATGFRFLARVPGMADNPREVVITLTASWDEDPAEYELESLAVRVVPAFLEQRPYGDVVHPERETLLHRDNIYGSGPPLEEPGALTLNLIRDYLRPRSSVLDVGCGAGAYGPPLLADGHAWFGLETNLHCCEILERRQLPYARVSSETAGFPCGDGEFEDAICIEVLEHVAEAERFLAEIARSIRGRALFSVPNMEVIPYFSAWHVVPWHLLEADHKNFFTRASLRKILSAHFRAVEVFIYAEHSLRSREEIPLHVHLFAIAQK
ncbi:MAG: class I SAM-dependent methyltransferase [Chthoniobacterales bacterium]